MPSSACRPPPESSLFPYTTLFRSVAFQMRNGRALAGDHMFDQIADGNNPDHFTVLDHGEVTNVFLRHQAQTFVDAFTRLRGRNVRRDRKSTRLNSSHTVISYAVFCLSSTTRVFTLSLHDALPICSFPNAQWSRFGRRSHV